MGRGAWTGDSDVAPAWYDLSGQGADFGTVGLKTAHKMTTATTADYFSCEMRGREGFAVLE